MRPPGLPREDNSESGLRVPACIFRAFLGHSRLPMRKLAAEVCLRVLGNTVVTSWKRHSTANGPRRRSCELSASSQNEQAKPSAARSAKTVIGWIFKKLLGRPCFRAHREKMVLLQQGQYPSSHSGCVRWIQ